MCLSKKKKKLMCLHIRYSLWKLLRKEGDREEQRKTEEKVKVGF